MKWGNERKAAGLILGHSEGTILRKSARRSMGMPSNALNARRWSSATFSTTQHQNFQLHRPQLDTFSLNPFGYEMNRKRFSKWSIFLKRRQHNPWEFILFS
jgi:hypothetical protein